MRYCNALASLAYLSLVLLALPVIGSPLESIAVTNVQSGEGDWQCPGAEGIFIAFLVPGNGTVLVATKPFPGGQRAGSVEGSRLRFELAGLATQELRTESTHSGSLPIWGMVDRSLKVGQRSGCFSFGARDFSSEDDLKTYLHWILRDVFFRLRTEDNADPLALRLANRTITLEVSAPGHSPARLSVTEAGTVGLRLPEAENVYYFQPLILDEDAGRVAVKVLLKKGSFFGEGTAREIAFVIAGREAPGVTPGEPVLEIRTMAID